MVGFAGTLADHEATLELGVFGCLDDGTEEEVAEVVVAAEGELDRGRVEVADPLYRGADPDRGPRLAGELEAPVRFRAQRARP